MANGYRKALIRADSGEFHDMGNVWHSTAGYEDESITMGIDEANARAQALDESSMGVMLSPRVYNQSKDLTIGAVGVPLYIVPGAILRPPSGYTYTIAGIVSNDPGRQWIDESEGGMVVWDWGACEKVYPDWYGPIANTGTLDHTATIQAAIDNIGGYDNARGVTHGSLLRGSRPRLQLRSREYYITQLVIPNNTWMEGVHMGGQGALTGTTLVQVASSGVDMIRFDARLGSLGTVRFLSHVYIRNIQLIGSISQTVTTHGINFEQYAGSDAPTSFLVADTCIFENIYPRQLYGDGIRFSDGAVPCVLRNIRPFECFGAGIRYIRATTTANQAVLLDSISGDACRDGLIVFEEADNTSDAQKLTVTMVNIKSEHRVAGTVVEEGVSTTLSSWHADAIDGWQQDCIRFHNCGKLMVNLFGVNHHNGGTTTNNARCIVRITGDGGGTPDGSPYINYQGIGVTYRSAKDGWDGTPGGQPVHIRDETTSPAITEVPRTAHFGLYGLVRTANQRTIDASTDDLDVTALDTLFVNTISGDVELGGLVGLPGQRLHIIKIASQNKITIKHNKAAVGVPINCAGQRDHVIGSLGGAILICANTADLWYAEDAAEGRNALTISDNATTTATAAGYGMIRLEYANPGGTLNTITSGSSCQRLTIRAVNGNGTVTHGTGTDAIELLGAGNFAMPANSTLDLTYDPITARFIEVGRKAT